MTRFTKMTPVRQRGLLYGAGSGHLRAIDPAGTIVKAATGSTIYQNSLMNQPQPGFDWNTPGPGGMQATAVMALLQVRFRGL
jgi:hypothetical protein